MRRLLIALTSILLASTALVAAPVAVGALPSNAAATPGGAGVLDVTWDASGDPGVVDYKVQADQGGGEVTSVIVTAPATSAQLTGLGNGETYTVVVTARDVAQASLGSDSVIASTAVVAPSSVVVTPGVVTESSIAVSWTADNGGGTNTYDVTISPDAGAAGTLTDSTATSTTFSGLSASTAYTVTVVADNGVAPTASNTGSASTSAPVVVAPSNATIALASITTTSMTATFSADDGGGTNAYTLTVRTPDAAGTIVQTIPGASSPALIGGLTPATPYSVTVTADNGVAPVATSETSASTLIVAPTAVIVTIDDTSATTIDASWFSTGGTATYEATIAANDGGAVGGGAIAAGSSDTVTTFTGLTPNKSYTVTVVATNASGSAFDTADASTAVEAPSNVVVTIGTPGSTSLPVTWSATGAGLTYAATISPNDGGGAGAIAAGSTDTSTTFTGLTPNTSYTVTVVATNVTGFDSGSDTASTSAGQASAPQNVSTILAGPADDFVRVLFDPPADLAGGTVANYTVNLSNGDTLTVGGSPATFETVPAGTTVTATVIANTQAGPGLPSAASNSVTTSDVPGPVTGLSAEWSGASNTNAIDVDWTAPGDDGGLTITGYVVEVSPALENPIPVVDPGETAVTIGGLEQGTTYTITVRAQNDRGNSPGVSSGAVLVPTTPGTVTNLVVQQSPPFSPGIVLTWDLPDDDGGSPITGYRVSVDDQVTDVGPDITTVSFASLPVGDHNVTVQAITAAGLGASVTSPNFEVKAFPPFDSEEDFVTQIYADFLRRTPDAGGLAFWTARVADDGSNVQEIIEAFMRSPEFSPRRGVARLYFAYFNRQPDKGGFDFWTRQISSGAGTLESASQSFALSPEFQDTYGSLTNAEFVVLVYNNVLARRPDTGGFRFWLAELEAGMPRGRLMTLFSESPENIELSRAAVDVTVTYDGMLQREADAGGFAFWRDQIAGSTNALPTLIRQFYFSPEYADRVTR